MRKPRWKRKLEVLSVMWAMMPKTNLTMCRIAFWVGLKPSNHLLQILHEMKADGLLTATVIAHRPNMNKFQWSLTPDGIRKAEAAHNQRLQSWG